MVRVLCLTAALTLACAASASAATSSYVFGSGSGPIPGFAGDTLRADLAAAGHGSAALGAFHVVHRQGTTGAVFGESWGRIDCLNVDGDRARATGTIVTGSAPGAGIDDLAGHRVALTVVDGDVDTLHFDISFLHGADPRDALTAIPSCAPGIVPITVASGGFTVGP